MARPVDPDRDLILFLSSTLLFQEDMRGDATVDPEGKVAADPAMDSTTVGGLLHLLQPSKGWTLCLVEAQRAIDRARSKMGGDVKAAKADYVACELVLGQRGLGPRPESIRRLRGTKTREARASAHRQWLAALAFFQENSRLEPYDLELDDSSQACGWV